MQSKTVDFQLELRNRFGTLQELDYIDTMSINTEYMTQQSATSVAMTINKQVKLRMSSPTQALLKNRRDLLQKRRP